MERKVLVIGGAGFIGSNLVRLWTEEFEYDSILVMDYFGPTADPRNLLDLDGRFGVANVDLRDARAVRAVVERFNPHAVINCGTSFHFETFPEISRDFYEIDVLGTMNVLEVLKDIWSGRSHDRRYVHVSTDEVFGTLKDDAEPFDEESKPNPKTAYAIAKAAADEIVLQHYRSHGMDVVITHGSQTYGPNQRPDFLIPYTVKTAMDGRPIRIPDASTARDWIYVEDHCWGIMQVFEMGRAGERYCLAGNTERTNGEVVEMTCAIYERLIDSLTSADVRLHPPPDILLFDEVRPGRRVCQATAASVEWGWAPDFPFEVALESTVLWYINRFLGIAASN